MRRLVALVLALAALGAFPFTASAGCETWWTSCSPYYMNQTTPTQTPVCYRYLCYIS